MRVIKRIIKRIECLLCGHKYQAYKSVMDGNRRRTIWKCIHCGKEKIGI